jgi:D-alanine--poly(phosphoribitol) ligase subunit 1
LAQGVELPERVHDTLLTRILATARSFPERVAVKCHDGTLSYGELHAAAAATASALRALEPFPERVAIVSGDDRSTYAGLLGIWMAGAAYVPLNKANPARRNAGIIADAAVGAVLSSAPFAPAQEAAEQTGRPWLLVHPADRATDSTSTARASSREDLAYILFTSGSTGRPKGVPIRHGNLTSFCDAWLADEVYALSAADRFLQMFDLGFDLSVMNIFVPWSLGASVHVVPHGQITSLAVYKVMAEDAVTVALLVPSVLAYLSRYFDEIRLPELRYNLFCGEALPQSLAEPWSRCVPNARIQNTYGPTEATIFCFVYPWDAAKSAACAINDIVPIGWPLGETGALILDENGNEVIDETIGELCLHGPQVAREYWRNPERTAEAFFTTTIDGRERRCYRTGDLVSRLPDDSLAWRGRIDHQVKIDGHRVELAGIEAHAREVSDSTATAAIAVTGKDGGVRLVLFLEGGDADIEGITTELARRLPAYMRPHEIRRLAALPLNVNGKIDRKALAAL